VAALRSGVSRGRGVRRCGATARPRRRGEPPRPVDPDGHRTHPGREGHHAGRAGARTARPEPLGSGGGEADRHAVPGRLVVDEPGRLGEQGGRVVGARARRLVRRRSRDDPALARAARRPASGARDRGDEPRGAARRTRCDVVAVGSAAAADRCPLRPVRRTRPGAVVVRGLRGRAVHPGRNTVRGHARPGGWSPPVDHHAVGGAGATGMPHLRARLRDRHRVDAAGLLGASGAARRHLGVPAPVHPAGGPGAGRGPDRCRRA
jgi:hypothetical protein